MRTGIASRGAIALGLLLALALAGTAKAHALYVSSDPAADAILPSPPQAITITLSEAVEPGSPTIRVTNSSGARFDTPPVTLSADGRTISVGLSASGPGIFTVTWTVISAEDGHFTSGSFSYAVQNPDGSLPGPLPFSGPSTSVPPISPVEVALRFLGFFGFAITFGCVILALFVWLPAGRDPGVREDASYSVGLQALIFWARVGSFAFAISMATLLMVATDLEASTVIGRLAGSPYLLSVVLGLGLSAVLFIVLSRALALSRSPGPEALRPPARGALVLSLAVIVALSAGTHAAARPGAELLGAFANGIHLAGVAIWVGGLAGLVAVRSLWRREETLPLARYAFAGFSRLAGYAIVLVIGGGAILAVLLVGSWEALVATGYGWIVLAKVSLVVPMIAFGAFNRYRLIPETADREPSATAISALARNVRAEVALGAAILVLSAVLTSMSPNLAPTGGPQVFALSATSDGIRMDLTVTPYPTAPGVYTFSILLVDTASGQAYLGGRNGTLTFVLLNSGLPKQTVTLSGPHANHYFVTTAAMSRPGIWRVDALISRIDGFDLLATFHVPLLVDT